MLFFLSLWISSCSPIENVDSDKQSEYYVKYASEGLIGTGRYEYNVSYTDETGTKKSYRNMSGDSFVRIIGPVSVGFKASFGISIDNTNDTKARSARIEVKKDDNPFVVKVEKTEKGYPGVGVSYIIE